MNRGVLSVLLSALLLLRAQTIFADVYGKGGWKESGAVHIVKNSDDDTVSFYFCRTNDKATCKFLGPKERYTKAEVEIVRARLVRQVQRGVATDVTHFTLSAGVAALTAVLTGANPGFVGLTIKALLAAASSTVVLMKGYVVPDGNHVISKYRLVKAFANKRDLYVNEPMDEFAKRLSDVLAIFK